MAYILIQLLYGMLYYSRMRETKVFILMIVKRLRMPVAEKIE